MTEEGKGDMMMEAEVRVMHFEGEERDHESRNFQNLEMVMDSLL